MIDQTIVCILIESDAHVSLLAWNLLNAIVAWSAPVWQCFHSPEFFDFPGFPFSILYGTTLLVNCVSISCVPQVATVAGRPKKDMATAIAISHN